MKFAMFSLLFYAPSGHLANEKQLQKGCYKWRAILLIQTLLKDTFVCVQGRNDFAIFVITRELGILTWDEAFLSLRSTLLPESLRAKYCSLIIGQLS